MEYQVPEARNGVWAFGTKDLEWNFLEESEESLYFWSLGMKKCTRSSWEIFLWRWLTHLLTNQSFSWRFYALYTNIQPGKKELGCISNHQFLRCISDSVLTTSPSSPSTPSGLIREGEQLLHPSALHWPACGCAFNVSDEDARIRGWLCVGSEANGNDMDQDDALKRMRMKTINY
jgi:hypothetical protein